MKKVNPPGSQIEEVLFCLLTRPFINRESMMLGYKVLNLPDNVFRLRNTYNLSISIEMVDTLNKYGENVSYGLYSLPDKSHGIEVYERIQKHRKDGIK